MRKTFPKTCIWHPRGHLFSHARLFLLVWCVFLLAVSLHRPRVEVMWLRCCFCSSEWWWLYFFRVSFLISLSVWVFVDFFTFDPRLLENFLWYHKLCHLFGIGNQFVRVCTRGYFHISVCFCNQHRWHLCAFCLPSGIEFTLQNGNANVVYTVDSTCKSTDLFRNTQCNGKSLVFLHFCPTLHESICIILSKISVFTTLLAMHMPRALCPSLSKCLVGFTMKHTATQCSTLQYAATHCNALKITAIDCNTL